MPKFSPDNAATQAYQTVMGVAPQPQSNKGDFVEGMSERYRQPSSFADVGATTLDPEVEGTTHPLRFNLRTYLGAGCGRYATLGELSDDYWNDLRARKL